MKIEIELDQELFKRFKSLCCFLDVDPQEKLRDIVETAINSAEIDNF